MSTDDWKAELKRRIKDIKDRKKSESKDEIKRSVNDYRHQKKSAPVAPPTEKPVTKVEKAAPETKQEEKPATPPQPEKQEKQTSRERKKEQKSVPEGDLLFQLDEPAKEEPDKVKDEAKILSELKRLSGKDKPTQKKDEDSSRFDFDRDQPVKKQHEETGGGDVGGQRLRMTAYTKESPTTSEESDSAPADNLVSKDLDQYTPLDQGQFSEDLRIKREPESEFIEKDSDVEAVDNTSVYDRDQGHVSTLRFGAAGIDLGIILIIEGLILWVASMIVVKDPLEMLAESWIPFSGLLLLLHFLYYILFTASTGQTIGKSLLGIKAERKKVKPVGLYIAIARWIICLLVSLPFGLGYFFMFINREGKALHDVILRMRVKKIRDDQKDILKEK